MSYRYFITLLLWMGVIFYLSSIPHLGIGLEGYEKQLLRKSIHVGIYGILTFLMWFSFSGFDGRLFKKIHRLRGLRRTRDKKVLLCGVLATLYAVSDEIHQSFVPGRCGNAKGVLFDVIGIVVALICIHRFRRLHRLDAKAWCEKTEIREHSVDGG